MNKLKHTINTLANKLADPKELLQTLSYLQHNPEKKQLLVDISGIRRYDSGTGIPRVVKNQLHHLQLLAKHPLEVRAIYLSEDPAIPLHFYADTHTPITLSDGDTIYNPDLDPPSIAKATKHQLYRCYKNIGVHIATLIHDILPITHPQFFVKNQDKIHLEWLLQVCSISDLLITTTYATKKALNTLNIQTPKTITIPLGVEPPKTPPKTPAPPLVPNFLTVSTIEPRKAHAQLLDTFEILWQKDHNIHLTLVGKKGWNTQDLLERIQTHPQLDKKLFYKNYISDEELTDLYASSSALISCSYAEGFGLPLIEAALHHLPIIARDIPVFREIAAQNAYYLSNTTNPQIHAKELEHYLSLLASHTHPKSTQLNYTTWNQNASLTLKALTNVKN